MRTPRKHIAVLPLVILGIIPLLTSCTIDAPQAVEASTSQVHVVPTQEFPALNFQAALISLNGLEVKGRAPKTGYQRNNFGQRWVDVDRNGCDTRNDILSRDLTNTSYKQGTHNCVVLEGELADPYTGTDIEFHRGAETSNQVQIDHVVSLSNAWQTGAQQISAEQRTALANDPLNLLAVDGKQNQKKGDSDAATWLPPNKGFRCDYVARQVAIKTRYHLWVTPPEKEAMIQVLQDCPGPSLAGEQ